MRLKAITPLHCTPDEIIRRQGRYNRLAPPGFQITVVNLPGGPDVPRTMENRALIMASDPFVYTEGMATSPQEFDGIFVDCVLDPAVEELAEDAPVPVFGPLRLTLALLQGLGDRFATVTRNIPIGEAMQRKIAHYGFAHRLDSTNTLNLRFAEIADHVVWNGAMQGVLDRLETKGGVNSLINGCSAVDVTESSGGKVRVVDPVQTALQMIAIGQQARVLQ